MIPPTPPTQAPTLPAPVQSLIHVAGYLLAGHGLTAQVQVGEDESGAVVLQLRIASPAQDAAASARARILVPR